MKTALIAFGLLFAVACKQGLGDRCQVQSDCGNGLVCVIPPGGDLQSGGVCEPPVTDASTIIDGGTDDSGDASAESTDLSSTD